MTQPTLEDIGARVRALMKARGLSQADFAALVGMDQPRVSRALRGRYRLSLEGLIAIADALDVHVAELVDGRAEENP